MRGRPKKETTFEALVRSFEEEKALKSQRKKAISLTLSPQVVEQLDELAKEYTNGNRSVLLERVIHAFLIEADKQRNTSDENDEV